MTTSIILLTLLRTTLFLGVGGLVCWLVLRRISDRVPHLSRVLWLAVLLSGWFWIRPMIAIPYSQTATDIETQIAMPTEILPPNMPPMQHEMMRSFDAAHDVTQHIASNETAVAEMPLVKMDWKPLIFSTIFAVWLGGMVVSIFLAATGYLQFLLALRKTVSASDDFAGPWRQLLDEHGINSRTIPMLVSGCDASLGPALIRTVRGYRLVVPRELWSELSEAGRCGILKHELAHFRRRDVWKSFFVRVLALPHWFNPIAHLAVHRFEEAAEQLCDRAAFDLQQEGVLEFARTLLLLHENAPTRFVARQSIFGRGLQHRVACLLQENPKRKVSFMKKISILTAAAILLAACLFQFEFVEKTVALAVTNDSQAMPEEKIAIPADAPKHVTFQCKVLMPDGSPAKRCPIEFCAVGIRENPKDPQLLALGFDSETTYCTFTSGYNGGTDENGLVTIDAPPGGNALIHAYSPNGEHSLVSDPVTFVLQENQPGVTITLRKGIPLRGRVVYDDGVPAQSRTIFASRQLDLLTGKDVERLKDVSQKFCQEFQANVDENGEYSMYLVPGEYVVKEFYTNEGREKKLIVTEESENLTVDLKLPTPIRGKITLPDGSVPKNIRARRQIVDGDRRFSGAFNHLPDDTLTIPRSKDNQIIVMTEDGQWGIIHRIDDDDPGKFHEIVLQPTATVIVTFVDKARQPHFANETFRMSIGTISREGKSGGHHHMDVIPDMTSDVTGTLSFRLPPGTGIFGIKKNNSDVMPKTIYTLKPGETLELGTVEIESESATEQLTASKGDFRDFFHIQELIQSGRVDAVRRIFQAPYPIDKNATTDPEVVKAAEIAAKISTTVTTAKSTFMLGEPVMLSWNFANGNDCDVVIMTDENMDAPTYVWAVSDEGEILREKERYGFMHSGPIWYERIPAKDSFPYQVFLPDKFAISKPGRYTICIARSLAVRRIEAPQEDRNWRWQEMEDYQNWKKGFSITPVIASTTIEIVPTDPVVLGRQIDELVRTIQDRGEPEKYKKAEKALQILCAINDERAIPCLVGEVREDNYSFAFNTIDALSKFKSDAALEGIKKALTLSDGNLLTCAAYALAGSQHPAAIAELLKNQDHPYYSVRLRVVQAAKKMDRETALEMLRKRFNDSGWEGRVGEEARRIYDELTVVDNLVKGE